MANIAEKSPNQAVLWVKNNLFSSLSNSILTLLSIFIVITIIPPMLDWALFSAVWSGGADGCRANPEAACWPFIFIRFPQFFYGFYPIEQRWRVNIVLLLFFAGIVALMFGRTPKKGLITLFMLFILPIIAWILMSGGIFGLERVGTNRWGGLMLTLVLAATGIVISLPLGVLLALGRQADNMPAIKTICIVFIEFWRGVPLITVLFMATVMFPLFLPAGTNIDQLIRCMIGFALFSSAYMAEVVRGGLQSLPRGQYEAADALGLGYWRSMQKIILPQSLRVVIPGIVNTFIGLFKDTTLVLIVGLFDFLGMIQTSILSPNWSIKSVAFTGYMFAAITYFVFCYTMSQYSRYVERKLNVGRKRRTL